MTTIITLIALFLAAAVPCWFLLQEQRKNLQLEAEVSRAREQVRGYAELAEQAKKAAESAGDRSVELIRARERLMHARFFFSEWELAERVKDRIRITSAREALAKAIGLEPLSQRRIKEAS